MASQHKQPPLTVRLPADLREWLERYAAEHHLPVGRVIVGAVSDIRIKSDPSTRRDYRLDFVQEWQCEPPPYGAKFQVTRDEWTDGDDDMPLRIIREIRITGEES
jgi:hypothetical protein